MSEVFQNFTSIYTLNNTINREVAMMKCVSIKVAMFGLLNIVFVMSGCGKDDAAIREIVQEEIRKERENYINSFAPEKFSFGGALEKEWSHAQGVKTGNLIFIAGQQPYDTNLDEKGMPLTDLETGKSFQEQLRTVLGNIEKVLDNYDATMDDIVFLQCFVDAKAGKNEASFEGAAEVIREYFPQALQTMTFVMVDDLYGPEQLIEANAIAVVRK